MKTSRKEAWPRLKYARNAQREDDPRQVADNQFILVVNNENKTTFAGYKGDAQFDEGDLVYSADGAMDDDEIAALWDSPEARNRGTEAHLALELFFNSEPTYASPELDIGLQGSGLQPKWTSLSWELNILLLMSFMSSQL